MVAVAWNAPAIGTAATPHPTDAFAQPIPHAIEPFRSVGGVRLGFTVTQVSRRFGRPEHRFPLPHGHLAKSVYDDEKFEVGFGGPPVIPHGLHCTSGDTRPPSPSCTLYDHGNRSRPHMTFDFSELGHRLGDVELSVPTSRARQIIGTSR